MSVKNYSDEETLNLGVCPHCMDFTRFKIVNESQSKDILKCMICMKDVKQYKNGKIHYEKIADRHEDPFDM